MTKILLSAILVVWAASPGAAQGAGRRGDLERVQEELERTRKEIEEYRKMEEALKNDVGRLRSRTDEARQEASRLKRRIASALGRKAELDLRARSLSQATGVWRSSLDFEARQAAARVFSGESAVGLRELWAESFRRAAVAEKALLLSSLKGIDRSTQRAQAEAGALARDLAGRTREAERAALQREKELEGKEALYEETQEKSAAAARRVRELEESARALTRMMRELDRTHAARRGPQSGSAPAKNSLPWPASGKVASGFGRQRHPELGTWVIQQGIRLEVPAESPVRAVAPGRIIFSGPFRSYGHILILDHGSALYTVYGEMGEIQKKKGERVAAGEPLGRAGLAGGPAYFEIRLGSEARSPPSPGETMNLKRARRARATVHFLVDRGLPAEAADRTYEQLKIIDVLDFVQQNYVEPADAEKLIYGAASGMVRTLDPFSQFLEPELHKELKTETEGEFGGLGIRVGFKDGWLTVITPLPGSPAFRLGIMPNDRVTEVDGETTEDITLAAALKKLRGSPGTKVKLTVLRSPEGDEDGPWTTHHFEVARDKIKIESVQAWKISADVGYLRIVEFSARTPEDVLGALKDLEREGARSLVLDLRNNPGGLLSAAVEVASDFLGGSKLIVYTQGRGIEKPQEYRSAAAGPYESIPVAVLVNEGSASGAEIVAGAFQDHRRAVIMGLRTLSKASVQSVIPLSGGSGLRLTVARYFTPNGRMIHRDEEKKIGGITPDIVIPLSRETEAKLNAQWDLVYAKDRKPRSAVKPAEMIKDETLDRAVELLQARDPQGASPAKGG